MEREDKLAVMYFTLLVILVMGAGIFTINNRLVQMAETLTIIEYHLNPEENSDVPQIVQ